jgi:NitT/TauT family transport system ATP-binding protein
MDEPFASVDAQTREVLQEELLAIWSRERQTVIFVTHSIDEAITLGDRVVIMGARPGHVRADVAIPIERPRSVEGVRRHPAYVRLREAIGSQLRAQRQE